MILRIRLAMPRVIEDGDFVAWIDNNDHFNSAEGRARIFTSYESAINKMHYDPIVDYAKMMENTGSSYCIEHFIREKGWAFYLPNLEDQLNSLCKV